MNQHQLWKIGDIPTDGIVGTLIQGNTAAEIGGGLYIRDYNGGAGVGMSSTDSFNLNLSENVIVKNNTALNGGGIGVDINKADPEDGYTFNVNVNGANLIENTATESGGEYFVE